jgi:hypothetical protein
MSRFWIGVACAEHTARGRAGGFMQVGHGKEAPLRRLHAGDRIVYYSPARTLGGKDRLQAFTSIGILKDDRIYQADMGGGFKPFRRDVIYLPAESASILPLLQTLEVTCGKRNWGYPFRRGLIEITEHDFKVIADAMGVQSWRG